MSVISVCDLTGYIKGLLEGDSKLANLWVKGEISNFKQAASGHVYFTLKDSNSSIRTVMFRSRARLLRFNPENGIAVRVRGYVTVFERDGQYQLYAEEIEPDGAGALYAAFEKLKVKLAAEGLFDTGRKQAFWQNGLRNMWEGEAQISASQYLGIPGYLVQVKNLPRHECDIPKEKPNCVRGTVPLT
jgi:exonuclease VII large subunit